MALDPGTRLGSYEIVSPLGKGGIGEVCRSRDAKLGRDVACPDPSALAGSAQRGSADVVLVRNWDQELRRIVPTR